MTGRYLAAADIAATAGALALPDVRASAGVVHARY
jgi:hypothetical protein